LVLPPSPSLAGLVGPLYPSKVCKKPFQSLLKAFERHLKHLGRAFLNAFERPLKKPLNGFLKAEKDKESERASQGGRGETERQLARAFRAKGSWCACLPSLAGLVCPPVLKRPVKNLKNAF